MLKLKRMWFKFLLNKGNLITIDERHAKIGKTTMLIEVAKKYGNAIVVGTQAEYDNIKSRELYVNVYRLAEGFTIDLKGQAGRVMIDESVSPKMVKWLQENPSFEVVGGFIYKEKDDK